VAHLAEHQVRSVEKKWAYTDMKHFVWTYMYTKLKIYKGV